MIRNAEHRANLDKPYANYVEHLNSTLVLPKSYKYEAIDLFAGCGGLSLGFEAAGIKTTGYEMMEDFCRTYSSNLGGECICEKLTPDTDFPKVDIVIGGPPCQPFSVRGKQKGKEDERNGFPIFLSAVKRLKPMIFMFENVRGLLYKNKPYFDYVVSELRKLGYTVAYMLLNAVDYEVPQSRERVVCVGSKTRFHFPKAKDFIVTAQEALGDIINILPENPMFLTPSMDKYIASYEAKSCCKTPRDLHLNMPARTLTCRNLAGATSDMQRYRLEDGRRRRLIPREAARLQSFPDWFEFCGSIESQFNQIGNAVPPFLAYNIAKAIVEHIENPNYGHENYEPVQLSFEEMFDYA